MQSYNAVSPKLNQRRCNSRSFKIVQSISHSSLILNTFMPCCGNLTPGYKNDVQRLLVHHVDKTYLKKQRAFVFLLHDGALFGSWLFLAFKKIACYLPLLPGILQLNFYMYSYHPLTQSSLRQSQIQPETPVLESFFFFLIQKSLM